MQEQRKIGVILNYLNFGLRIISSFWVTRIVVNALGMSEYGLISIAGSILVLLPILDFGVKSTVSRYAPEYKAKGDMEGLRNFLGICQKFFYIIAALAALICTVIYFRLENIFYNLSPEELEKTRIMYIMLSIGSVLYFTQCLYLIILSSFERYVFVHAMGTFTLVFTAIGSILFVKNGYGAVGVTAIGLALQIINIFPARIYCWKKLKLIPNLRYWDFALMKKCSHYSIWVFMGSVSSLLGESIAPLIIGSACTPADAGVFRIGTIITGYFLMGSSVSNVFYPKVVSMATHQAGRKEFSDLFIRIGRLDFMIALMFVGGFFLLGRDFMNLWLVNDPELKPYSHRAWQVGMVCSVFVPFYASTVIGWYVLHAKNLLKFRVIVSLGTNLAATIIGYLLTLKYGMFGLLWTRFALPGAALIVFSFWYFEKAADLDVKAIIKHTYTKTFIPVIVASACILLLLHYYPIRSWIDFLTSGVIYVAIFIGVVWVFVANSQEKHLIASIWHKGKNIWKKIWRKILK